MNFEKLKEKIKIEFEQEKRGAAHDFSHIERVLENAIKLANENNADLEVVKYAALLHDYKREAEHELEGNHALESSKAAREILKEHPKVGGICHAIEAHSRSSNIKPETLEAKIIYDADKMDSVGTIGVIRYLCQGDELGWSIKKSAEEYKKRSEKFKETNFYTKTGKRKIEKGFKEAIKLCNEIIDY